ncbi:hypothetical protein SAMN05660657_05353 [Geodermatophilus amargosae]|uniref:Uncharacterized protein n=1 Tax=Geodermatophilus amargosae TaxID=1296565 RepID=A0A1I7D627_9ACTN|nr:hypothetical protein [Geodermatophilus amargosae]SFU07126.1 hypothetical protein SAMN05660657_05353 [Geodermatophilus amargosae]
MAIRWFSDKDRQELRDAAEEARVLAELEQKFAVYREADRTPLTEGQLRILNGELKIDPNGRAKD